MKKDSTSGIKLTVCLFQAAHCIQNKASTQPLVANDFSVLLGRYNLKTRKELGSMQLYLSGIIVHPAWDPQSIKWDADIAVLVMNEPAPLSNFIQPACLPKNNQVEQSEFGTVVRKFVISI